VKNCENKNKNKKIQKRAKKSSKSITKERTKGKDSSGKECKSLIFPLAIE
jgi:hypothetical protein